MKKYDTLYLHGNIFTSDTSRLRCDAFAVKDGRFAWVGDSASLDAAPGSLAEEVVDLQQAYVLPGFVDSHMHAIMLAGCCRSISVLPPHICSIEELVQNIRATEEKQGVGPWILGYGYDESKLAEKTAPTVRDLDRGSSRSPVLISRTCGHIVSVNSVVLALAGITRDTPDPEGGRIGRFPDGTPNGILYENARSLATDLQPVYSPEEVANQLMDLNDLLLSQGVTTASDMGEFLDYDEDTIFRLAAERGFKVRIAGYTMWDLAKKKKDFTTPPTTLQASGIFHKQGIKIIGDGSISGQTAWSYEPYQHSDSCGLQVDSDEDIQNALAFCRAHHCQLSIHAMGSRTLDNVLSLVAGASPWLDPAIPSIRMEHTTEPSAEAICQAVRADIAFVTQPVFQYAEIETYLENIGVERTRRAYPIADFLDAGLRFAFSTDAPATSWALPSDPMVTLKAAVTRRSYNGIDCGQRHRVDLETAIRLYTAENAPMLGFTDVGRIQAGYHADFLILDRDIFSVDPSEIDQVTVQQTFVNGVLSYEKTA